MSYVTKWFCKAMPGWFGERAPILGAPPALNSEPYQLAPLRYAPECMLSVIPGDIISDSLIANGVWELELTQAMMKDAGRGGLLVEVGANLGYFAVLWAAADPANHVIAFEPAPRNLDLFRHSIDVNKLRNRIEIYPVAAGPALRRAHFDLGPEAQTGWGGVLYDPNLAIAPASVIVVPLDPLLSEAGPIRVLKIDVEGYDTEVLAGCRWLLAEKRIETIYYEQNRPRMDAIGIDPQRAVALLAEVGYKASLFSGGGTDVEEWIAVSG
jgi:FkbM family methyltransferase